MATAPAPERGDIVWLDFNPQAGHEQAGLRPAVVLSPRAYNGIAGLALVCPVTTRVKGYPFEVALLAVGTVQGVVLADQIRSVDWRARLKKRGGRVPATVMSEILAKSLTLLE